MRFLSAVRSITSTAGESATSVLDVLLHIRLYISRIAITVPLQRAGARTACSARSTAVFRSLGARTQTFDDAERRREGVCCTAGQSVPTMCILL